MSWRLSRCEQKANRWSRGDKKRAVIVYVCVGVGVDVGVGVCVFVYVCL